MLKLQIKWAKSRPYISNSIRLLSPTRTDLSEVESGKLSQAHARSLVGLNKEQQDYFFQRIIEEDISVRKLEALQTEKTKETAKMIISYKMKKNS